MERAPLHDLNQRYVRLTDRCRSQWTFYQFLQGLFKHLRGEPCSLSIDYQGLFGRLRDVAEAMGQPDPPLVDQALRAIGTDLDRHVAELQAADTQIPPSVVRRFIDRLRTQDEKILMALAKFYLGLPDLSADTLDKLDVLLTRLAENPLESGGSLPRERHELERVLQPLLQFRSPRETPDHEVGILLQAIGDLRAEALASRTFVELVSGGVLERFRTLKKRLGDNYLNGGLLPTLLETTVVIKNHFRELLAEEETQLLEDTNRVRELQRQARNHPELVSPELQEVLERFSTTQQRFEQGRNEDNLRREDVLELRLLLNRIVERFDPVQRPVREEPTPAPGESLPGPRTPAEPVHETVDAWLPRNPGPEEVPALVGNADPLLQEFVSKMVFAIELVGRETPVAELLTAKELATLRLEAAEVRACLALMDGSVVPETLPGERDILLVHAAALRLRIDEEAREIERLHHRGSDHLAEILERSTASLGRAADFDRRFRWFLDDCFFRGVTADLAVLQRSHFRLLRAYAGLWLVHNQRGGVSPL